MYYSAIGILAAMILVIENHDILLNRNRTFEQPAWKVYRKFLFAILAYYASDILWGVFEAFHMPGALFADTTVYFFAMAAGILFWTQYAVIYLEEKGGFGSFVFVSGRIVAALIIVSALFNIFTPVLFTVDGRTVYSPLPFRYVILGCQIVVLALISIFAVFSIYQENRNSEKRKKYRTLAYFGMIMAAFLCIQLWYPSLPLYSIAYMLGTCLLRTFVIGDEKDAYRRELEETARAAQLKETIATLLDNMPGMIFTKDAQKGVYLACNQAFADHVHRETPDDVAGLTDIQLFDAEQAAHHMEDDRMTLSMDEPYIFFEEVLDGEGKTRQLQTTKLKYTDAAGCLCVLGMCQDVTDVVRVQREDAATKEDYEKARSTSLKYSQIAQTMTQGFEDLYYVNIDSEEYIEYQTDEENGSLFEVRRGFHFFEECQIEAQERVYPDDLALFLKALDRKNLVAALDRNKAFVITYRLNSEHGPYYVSLRASRMEEDERFVILGVTDIDEQMKQRRLSERMKEEQTAYNRLAALTGDFLCIYVVVPETGYYREFSSNADYESLAQAKAGEDFFAVTRAAARQVSHPEDVNRVLAVFTKENVLSEIARRGIFTLSYRIMMKGRPIYVQLKAAMVEEKEGRRLIVGVSDIDAQVRQEEDYMRDLAQAWIDANIDALTHVKNRHAYLAAEEHLDQQIKEGHAPEFAIVILDVNDLKKVNDTAGHKTGDQYLRGACKIICDIFDHSPVFRIGGDEFAVIVQGRDYECVDELVEQVGSQNARARQTGGIVIACGMARFEEDSAVAPVFERADQRMYDNKCDLKAGIV